jgi:hypothetical protein
MICDLIRLHLSCSSCATMMLVLLYKLQPNSTLSCAAAAADHCRLCCWPVLGQ